MLKNISFIDSELKAMIMGYILDQNKNHDIFLLKELE